MGDEGHTATRVSSQARTQVAPQASPSLGAMRAPVPAGKRLGRYVVERTIGQGGMGIVVAARHEQLGELVAIKLLHPKAAVDKIQVERFVREARATARIKSDHVVRVLDAGEEEGTNAPFIVMELLQGRDVGRMLTEGGALPVQLAVDLMIQVCEAASGAHALGIIHRDLKPANFFVTSRADGTPLVKVLDFGISKALQQDGAVDPNLTETQAVFGSPTYMSPEQIRSSKNVDARSDVWSLGVALFEMLSAKLPFEADNVSGLLAAVVADPPSRLIAWKPDVPEGLEAIVLACLEKDPSRRIQSAVELATRLAAYASPEARLLAERIERVAAMRGSSSSSHSQPPPPRTSHPSVPPVAPLPPLSRPPPAPSSQVSAFATTEGDVGATSPGRADRSRNAKMALGFAGLAVAGILGGIALVSIGGSTPPPAPAAAPTKSSAAPVETAAQPPVPVVIAPPSVTASVSAAPEVAASVATPTKRGKGGGRGTHGTGHAAGSASVQPSTPPQQAAPGKPSTLDDRF